MSEKFVYSPLRPEIQYAELLDKNKTSIIVRQEIHGRSPRVIDHLSELTIGVVRGEGSITHGGMTSFLSAGSEVVLDPGSPFRYAGTMDWLVKSEPPTDPQLVTLDKQKLGFIQRLRLKQRRAEAIFNAVISEAIPEEDMLMALLTMTRGNTHTGRYVPKEDV